jgi:membrane protein YqaA with SNARE-associated domain
MMKLAFILAVATILGGCEGYTIGQTPRELAAEDAFAEGYRTYSRSDFAYEDDYRSYVAFFYDYLQRERNRVAGGAEED